MSEQEYREFWISKRSNEMLFSKAQLGSTIYVFNYKIEASSICAEEKDIFHVIEHRAFQSAQDKIKQLEMQSEIYRKALEFYANKKNWDDRWRESDDGNDDNSGDIFDVINIGDVEIVTEKSKDYDETFIGHYTHGGERARQAIKDAEAVK